MSKSKLALGQPENVKLIDKATGKVVMESQAITLHFPKAYKIDWTKVETFEDMKKVMGTSNITIYDNFEHFETIKPFLIES